MLFTIILFAFAIGAFLFIREWLKGVADSQEVAYRKVKAKEKKFFKWLCLVAGFWAVVILIWKKHVATFGLGVTFIVLVVFFVLLWNTINDIIIGKEERKAMKLHALAKLGAIWQVLYLLSWIVIEAR